MKTNNENSDAAESFDSSDLLSDDSVTEFWGIERDAGISCYYRVKWANQRKADESSESMLRGDSSIICIHRLKEPPKGKKVVG